MLQFESSTDDDGNDLSLSATSCRRKLGDIRYLSLNRRRLLADHKLLGDANLPEAELFNRRASTVVRKSALFNRGFQFRKGWTCEGFEFC
jgi:hypothetical protein